ncbi:relaxase/mobilization nuclease domain-containing protein [Tritonibacter mobilis]|uniref:relaxase/mobilization nuclease domain-containing protein n=1 Tax=Tritonibacter mobilis TaxID=379347 RepID=UPI000806A08F|nr:relaxase/mobilization nuclease domain-containing protein [Tritonibacter mobilis]
MILKGSSRAHGGDLATHLLNAYDNERVELAHMRGTISEDLHGALAEFEAVASGTRAQKPLFSLSMNPSDKLSREQYFEAIDAVEKKLGFTGQPRAVVFHIKDGREHCHVVWSRIDGANMKAIPDSFYKAKLCDMSVALAEKFGHDLPEGLKRWKEKNRKASDKLEPTLGETANEKKTGISAEQRRKEITAAYEQADNAAAFQHALEEKGYILAQGDRRSYVLVDAYGDVHSLSRCIKGVRAKEIKARLAPLAANSLPSVDDAKDQAREQQRAADDAKAEAQPETETDAREEKRKRAIAEKHAAMKARQAARQLKLQQAEQALLTRQQGEKLALDAAQKAESGKLLFRVRAKVAELIEGRPALRSVLGHITAQAGLDPRERHRLEQEALARRHAREKKAIAGCKQALAKSEQRERASLARDRKREALQKIFQQEQQRAAAKAEAAKAQEEMRTDRHLLEEDALAEEFNKEAQLDLFEDEGQAEDEGRKPRHSWKERFHGKGTKKGRGRRGYRYRRDGKPGT